MAAGDQGCVAEASVCVCVCACVLGLSVLELRWPESDRLNLLPASQPVFIRQVLRIPTTQEVHCRLPNSLPLGLLQRSRRCLVCACVCVCAARMHACMPGVVPLTKVLD
jgi:hypothetical protein